MSSLRMRCGVVGRALVLLALLAWPDAAQAQSEASFPEPAPPTPPAAAPPPPIQAPPPAPAMPPPAAPPPAAPVSTPDYVPPSVALPAPDQPAAAPQSYAHLPPLLPYKQGLPVPEGYRVVQRSASGLTIGGALTFGAAYVAALGLAATQDFDNGTAYAAIPVAGPWAAIGGRSFKCKTSIPVSQSTTSKAVQTALNKCVGAAFDEVVTVVFLTADGLVQATGAVLFFIGLGSGYQELVRKDLPKAAIVPLPGGGAISVSGNF